MSLQHHVHLPVNIKYKPFLIPRRRSTKIFPGARQEHSPLLSNKERRTTLFPWFSPQLRSQSTNGTNNGHFQTPKNLGGSVTTAVLVCTPFLSSAQNPTCVCWPNSNLTNSSEREKTNSTC